MSPWLALIPVTLCSTIGAYITFVPRLLNAWWAPLGLMLIGMPGGPLWAWACRQLDDAEKIKFSLVWDACIFLPYYGLPILLGVKPTPATWIGLTLVLAGMLVVKHN